MWSVVIDRVPLPANTLALMTNDIQTGQMPESVALHGLEDLQGFPPSCKLAFYAFSQAEEMLNVQQLDEEMLLPRRTIRYALSRLWNHDIISTWYSLRDARTTKHLLHEMPPTTNDTTQKVDNQEQ